MSGRNEGRGESARTWLRGVLVIVVIAAVLGVFSDKTPLRRPQLGALQLAGIAVMLLGLAVVLLAGRLAERLSPSHGDRTATAFKLCGVTVCAAGAMMVLI